MNLESGPWWGHAVQNADVFLCKSNDNQEPVVVPGIAQYVDVRELVEVHSLSLLNRQTWTIVTTYLEPFCKSCPSMLASALSRPLLTNE